MPTGVLSMGGFPSQLASMAINMADILFSMGSRTIRGIVIALSCIHCSPSL
jgi:hypothetical protein